MLYLFVVSQDVLHNCQLHRISFCADDKTDKRIFTFICKDSESNKHLCYVFDSEKCVSVICVFFFLLISTNFCNISCRERRVISIFHQSITFTGSRSKRNTVVSRGLAPPKVRIIVFALLLQAEEITLTIGQAFDLAYKKFLESGGKDVETRKQIGSLQKRV